MPESPAAFFRDLAGALRTAHVSDWSRIARPNQLAPPGTWSLWLILTGRGWGKTRALTEWARSHVEAETAKRIALVGPTAADVRDVLVEGETGILAVSPDHFKPKYESSKRRLTWPNGAVGTTFSADEPDRLRGPQHDLAICDELAAWQRPEALDMLLLGLRLGKNPRVAIATTPRPTRAIRELLAREGRDVVVTRGSTLENRSNLSPVYVEQILSRYRGTRLERQEVHGEVLDDTPGALWRRDMLDACRAALAPPLQRVVVAIDPAGSSQEGADETGVVVCGVTDGHGYVLEDLSGRYAPHEWAARAIAAYRAHRADRIIAESNYGGEMVAATIAAVDANVPVKLISSSRGKVLRAEPIAAFFEQHRAHMVGSFPVLEDQLCAFTTDWSRARDGSPDRVDAMVFALTELMDDGAGFQGWVEYEKAQAARARVAEDAALPAAPLPWHQGPPAPTAKSEDPEDLISVYGRALLGYDVEASGTEQCSAGCGRTVAPGEKYIELPTRLGERCHEACYDSFALGMRRQ